MLFVVLACWATELRGYTLHFVNFWRNYCILRLKLVIVSCAISYCGLMVLCGNCLRTHHREVVWCAVGCWFSKNFVAIFDTWQQPPWTPPLPQQKHSHRHHRHPSIATWYSSIDTSSPPPSTTYQKKRETSFETTHPTIYPYSKSISHNYVKNWDEWKDVYWSPQRGLMALWAAQRRKIYRNISTAWKSLIW